ncbi:hypothetical protein B9479_008391, partial [Cryptococcus floricola]
MSNPQARRQNPARSGRPVGLPQGEQSSVPEASGSGANQMDDDVTLDPALIPHDDNDNDNHAALLSNDSFDGASDNDDNESRHSSAYDASHLDAGNDDETVLQRNLQEKGKQRVDNTYQQLRKRQEEFDEFLRMKEREENTRQRREASSFMNIGSGQVHLPAPDQYEETSRGGGKSVEKEDQLASALGMIAQLLQNQQQARSPSAETRDDSKEPRVNDPEEFSGNRNDLKPFLTSCQIVFDLQPKRYNTD